MASAPDDKTRFKDLVQDVVPLAPGPRVVTSTPGETDSVVVRVRKARTLEVEELNGVIAAHATDASPRLAHELGALPPNRQYQRLDLHRMSASQATHALHATITQARADGEIYLIVICGKGTHSGAVGPVLSSLVVEELSGPLAAQIVAFRTAPRALGGEGAIVVRLRRKARPKAT